MFKQYFLIFLLGHILGDFYFQTERIADKKEERVKWVLFHCFLYLAAMILVLLPIISVDIVEIGICVSGTHALIDIVKYCYVHKMKNDRKMTFLKNRNIFLADQFLHICVLALGAVICVHLLGRPGVVAEVAELFRIVGISKVRFLSWAVAFLLIHKPANILISKLLRAYKPFEKNEEIKRDNNAGRFIGTLERLLILMFISIEQYSAIGLVLTAKSIARYDRISKEKDFAEYYLLGTLLSTVVVVGISRII